MRSTVVHGHVLRRIHKGHWVYLGIKRHLLPCLYLGQCRFASSQGGLYFEPQAQEHCPIPRHLIRAP